MATKRKRQMLDKLKRTEALMIRLRPDQHRAFEQRASKQGLATSAWARMILLRELEGNQDHK